MNVIVVAAIALVVLIVLIVVFTGRIRTFSSGTDDCLSRGGTCEDRCELDCEAPTPSDYCVEKMNKRFCCIPFKDTCKNNNNY